MPRLRRRVAIAIVIALLAAIAGVVIYATGHRKAASRGPGEVRPTNGVAMSPGAKDGATGAPLWFGQSGARGRPIAGVVLAEGAPVRGATVRLASKLTWSGLIPEPRVVTDEAGRFDFGPQLAAVYVVVAELPHLTGALESIDLRNPAAHPPPDQLRLVLHACDAAIHGTIRDAAGGVISKARVMLTERDMVPSGGVEADDQGSYELCVPMGDAAVTVKADGYAQSLERVTALGRVRRDFSLIPEAAVLGRVVRADDQSPVAGAIVDIDPAERSMSAGPLRLSAMSDSDGRFHIDGVAPGRHVITATAERLATPRPVEVVLEIGKAPEDVVCALAPTLAIAGKVVEQGTSTPVPGLTILVAQRAKIGVGEWPQALSQPDGTFVIDGVSPGEYTVFVYSDGLAGQPPTVKVDTSDISDLVLEVERRASISGRVTHGGKPIDGAQVHVQGGASASRGVESDSDGNYTLRGLSPGSYSIYAESKRAGAFTNSPPVTVAKGEQKTGVDVEMDLAGSIAGIVVDQKAAPVPGVLVNFSLLHGRDFGTATTADDGSFIARALSGGGDYLYEVVRGSGSTVSYPPAEGKRFPPIAVADGQTRVTGLRIQIRLDRLSIAGHVIDSGGKPVPDVEVSATPVGGWSYAPPSATSGVDGGFTIRDLPAGMYNVSTSASPGHEREQPVAAGRTDVVLRMADAGGIEGTLEGFTGAPEVVATGDAVAIVGRSPATRFASATSPLASTESSRRRPPGAMARV